MDRAAGSSVAEGVGGGAEREQVGLDLEAEREGLMRERDRIPPAAERSAAALERRGPQEADAVEFAAERKAAIEPGKRPCGANASGARRSRRQCHAAAFQGIRSGGNRRGLFSTRLRNSSRAISSGPHGRRRPHCGEYASVETRGSSSGGRPIQISRPKGSATSSAKKRPTLRPSTRRTSSPQSQPYVNAW